MKKEDTGTLFNKILNYFRSKFRKDAVIECDLDCIDFICILRQPDGEGGHEFVFNYSESFDERDAIEFFEFLEDAIFSLECAVYEEEDSSFANISRKNNLKVIDGKKTT